MDENKEKELLGEEAEEKLTEQEKEEVGEILGNLENQEETQITTDWDGLAQIGDDSVNIEEDETVEEIEEEKEIEEDMLCEKCGKRERYTELDEEYPYCKACREKMKKTRMNGWGVFFFVSVLLGCIGYIVYSVAFLAVAAPIIKGDMYMAEGKYTSAISCYEETINTITQLNQSSGGVQIFDAGDRTYAKIAKAYFCAGTPTYAQDYYSALEQSGALDKFGYEETREYYEIYDKMMDTYSNLQTAYSSKLNSLYSLYMSDKKSDISTVKDELKELESLKANKENDRYMIAYFQYLFCSFTENSTDESIKYLEEVKLGGRAYTFIYAIELCSLYMEKGEYDKAEAICYQSLDQAPESLGVYQYLMMSKRRQGDYKAALKLGEEAAKIAETIYVPEGSSAMPYGVPMEESIVFALMGEKEKAIAAIDASNQLGSDKANLDLAILFHYLYHVKGKEPEKDDKGETVYDGVDGIYDQGMSIFSYYQSMGQNMKISDNVQAIMDGKKTLEDVFVKGEVNWQ